MIYVLAIMVVCAIILYAMICAAAPRNDKERRLDDEAQMKYIEDYKKNIEECKKHY